LHGGKGRIVSGITMIAVGLNSQVFSIKYFTVGNESGLKAVLA
jgi:hypothetical protein